MLSQTLTKTCKFIPVALAASALAACGAAGGDYDDTGSDNDQDLSSEAPDVAESGSALTEEVEEYGGYAESELRDIMLDGIQFRVPSEFYEEDEATITVSGNFYLETPSGVMTLELGIGEVVFDKGNDGSIQTVAGEVTMPLPKLGFLDGAVSNDLPMVAMGYDFGADISENYDVGVPLQDDTKYLYFTFSTGASIAIGDVELGIATSQYGGAAMVLDPTDPMFGFYGDLDKFSTIGSVEGIGMGFSLGGNIPYAPDADWFLEENSEEFTALTNFDGHLYMMGTVPLGTLPLSLDGNVTIDVDPDDDGDTVFTNPAEGAQLGFNGTLNYSFPFEDDLAEVISLDLTVGNASAGITLGKSEQGGFFSGELQNPSELLPSEIPVSLPDVELVVAGAMYSEAFSESFFEIRGEMTSMTSQFPMANALPLSDGFVADGRLRIDGEQLIMTGSMDASPVNGLIFNGDAEIELVIPWNNPDEFSFLAAGTMTVGGTDIGMASLQIDRNGVIVEGSYSTGMSTIAIAGEFTANGFQLTGSQSVTVPLSYLDETIEWVTDAALCGYDTVTDAAKCGTKWVTSAAICGTTSVTSAAECGTSYVVDAAKCGTKTVTSAAQCGTSYVTSGAKCGYKTVTSSAICGTETIKSGSKCGYNWVKNVFKGKWKKKPKSCKVAKTCTTAASCNVANTCNVAKGCNVAKTCNIDNSCSTPKTCEVAATCEKKTEVELPFGDFVGNIEISVGTNGVSGDVSGEYCSDVNNKCGTIASGDVSFGNPNKACVNVPVAGKHCTKF